MSLLKLNEKNKTALSLSTHNDEVNKIVTRLTAIKTSVANIKIVMEADTVTYNTAEIAEATALIATIDNLLTNS